MSFKNITATNSERLSSLVARDLRGADLLAYTEVEDLGAEKHFIVLWKREAVWGTEYGTHRAVLSADHGILIWGNYLRTQQAARANYDLRCASI